MNTTSPWTIRNTAANRYTIARQRFPGPILTGLAAAWAAIRRKTPKAPVPSWEPMTFNGRVLEWDTVERANDALDTLRAARVSEPANYMTMDTQRRRFVEGDELPTIETL